MSPERKVTLRAGLPLMGSVPSSQLSSPLSHVPTCTVWEAEPLGLLGTGPGARRAVVPFIDWLVAEQCSQSIGLTLTMNWAQAEGARSTVSAESDVALE